MPNVDRWVISHKRIHEEVVHGKRLGRHIKRDSRSDQYPYRRSGTLLNNNEVTRYIPILDQGNVGSCTGNAETGELGSGEVHNALFALVQAGQFPGLVLDENFALSLYSAAESIDGDGPYPPNDNGSSGLSVAQAAKNGGWISSYVHCNGLQDMLDALSAGSPVIVGTNWYDSMDQPDPQTGIVTISPNAAVRGGHEYLSRCIDVDNRMIGFDNSWGTGFGINGSFWYSWDTMDRLLAEQGDATVSVPVVVPGVAS